MLEILSHLSKTMGNNMFTCTFSLDMSAAFDLLCPDVFNKHINGNVDLGLLWTLMGFLKDRKFIVRYEPAEFYLRDLDHGWVQGSVLGQALFSAYSKDLDGTLVGVTVKSFVVITASSLGK